MAEPLYQTKILSGTHVIDYVSEVGNWSEGGGRVARVTRVEARLNLAVVACQEELICGHGWWLGKAGPWMEHL